MIVELREYHYQATVIVFHIEARASTSSKTINSVHIILLLIISRAATRNTVYWPSINIDALPSQIVTRAAKTRHARMRARISRACALYLFHLLLSENKLVKMRI